MIALAFDRPAALWLLLLVPLLAVLLLRRSQAPSAPRQLWLTAAMQALAITALVLAIAEPVGLDKPTTRSRVCIVCGDMTDTVRGRIEALRNDTPSGDRFVLIERQDQDITTALRQARQHVPAGEPGDVFLFSDGQNSGAPPARVANELRNLQLHYAQITTEPRPRLVRLLHPGHVREGEALNLLFEIEAPRDLDATLRADLASGKKLQDRKVRLHEGRHRYRLPLPPLPSSPEPTPCQASVVFGSETLRQRFCVLVGGRVRVRHIGTNAQRDALATTLRPLGFDVVDNDADVVVVDDVTHDQWSRKDQEAVRKSVLEDGAGLLLAGAERNLGPGGYGSSPLADVLPVDMPQREERRDPSTALVIIIDTSGSMGGNRVELAKEVARLAMRRLLPHDKVGIVEFHGAKRWAAPLQPASNSIELQRALNRLQAGGGTVIYSALEESYFALLNARTRFKHILVLTDGGVESGPFEALARRMASGGHTLSTVLIGPQSNSPFLMSLAQWGRGRFYSCPSRFQLPELRFKEPQSSPLRAVQEGRFAITGSGRHEATAAFANKKNARQIRGMVEARTKPGASQMLTSDGRALLAQWDQGLGRVAVLATELLGLRTGPLRGDDAYGTMLADLLRGLSRGRSAATRLEVRPEGGAFRVTLHSNLPTWPTPVLKLRGETFGMTPSVRGEHVSVLPWPGDRPFRVDAVSASDTPLARSSSWQPLPGATADVSDALRAIAKETSLRTGIDVQNVPRSFRGWCILLAIGFFLASLLLRRLPLRVAPPRGAAALLAVLLVGASLEAQAPERIRLDQGDLEQELKKTPADRFVERALLLEAMGEETKSLAAVERILAGKLPTMDRAHWQVRRAELQMERKQIEAARDSFRAAVKIANNSDFSWRVGHLAGSYGLQELALAWHTPGARTGKTAFHVHLRRGLWQQQRGDTSAAILELQSGYPNAKMRRDRRFVLAQVVSLARKIGRKELLQLCGGWLNESGDMLRLQTKLQVLQEIGEFEAALQMLVGSPELTRKVPVQEVLSLAVSDDDATAKSALSLAQRMLEDQPKDYRLRTALALVLTDRNETDSAARMLSGGIAHASSRKDLLRIGEAAMQLNLKATQAAVLRELERTGEARASLQALLLQVAHLRERRKDKQAIEMLVAAKDKFKEPALRLRVAEQLESLGKRETAIALYRSIFQKTQAEDLGLRLAWMLGEGSKPEEQKEALAIYRSIWLSAGSRARRVQAEERVLDQATRNGTLADLAIELEESLEKAPGDPHRELKRQALVKIYGRAGDSLGAAALLRAMAKEPGREVEAYQRLARVHLENEEFRAHERSLRHLLEIDPEGAITYRQEMALSAMERGRPADAKRVIDELLEQKTDDAKAAAIAWEFAAGIYSLAGRPADAVKVYEEAIERNPNRIETLLLWANGMRDDDRAHLALGTFSRILHGAPKDDLFLVAIDGMLNLDADRRVLAYAARATRRRLTERPDKVYLHRVLQDVLETLGDETARRRSMEEMLLVSGEQRVTFLRELMDEAQAQRKDDEYLAWGRQLLFLGDEVPPAVFLELGEALLRQGKLPEAERAFRRARLATDFAATERRIANAFTQAGRLLQAQRIWRRILRRDPDNPGPRMRVARLAEQLGDNDTALLMYRQVAAGLLEDTVVKSATTRRRSRNRNVDSREKINVAEALGGALRSARKPEDLAPLEPALDRKLASAKSAVERIGAIEQLRSFWRAVPTPTDNARSRQQRKLAKIHEVEDEILKDRKTDVAIRRKILRRRLLSGDLAAAQVAVEASPTEFKTEALQLLLLRGDAKQILELLAEDTVRKQADAVLQLRDLGYADAANTLWARIEDRLKKEPAQRAQAVAAANPRPKRDPQARLKAAERRLTAALARPRSYQRRAQVILSAIATHPTLDKSRKQQLLDDLHAEVTRKKDRNLTLQYVDVARGIVPAARLLPLAMRAFGSMQRYYEVISRAAVLDKFSSKEQIRVLDRAIGKFSQQEQTTLRIRLLPRVKGLALETVDHIVNGLSLRSIGLPDRYQLNSLCISAELPAKVMESLFVKLRAERSGEPETFILAARLSKNEQEKQVHLAKVISLIRAKKGVDHYRRLALQKAVAMLSPEASQRLLEELAQPKTDAEREIQVALLGRAGRSEAMLKGLRLSFQHNPSNSVLFQKLFDTLKSLRQMDEAIKVFETWLSRQPKIYPFHASQLATLYLGTNQPQKALELLNRAEDRGGMLSTQKLQAIARLKDSKTRQAAARAWLQLEQRNKTSGIVIFSRIGWDRVRHHPKLAFTPRQIPASAPKTLAEVSDNDAREVLRFFPEGREIARLQLRMMNEEQRMTASGLYRAWLSGKRGSAVLTAARARLQANPHDAEGLRIAWAAAQLGMSVTDEEVTRAMRPRLLFAKRGFYRLPVLAEILLLANERGMHGTVDRLLDNLLRSRGTLSTHRIQHLLPGLLTLAASRRNKVLLDLLPTGKDASQARVDLDGELLIALWDIAEPAAVLERGEALVALLTDPQRDHQRERIGLPWCGWNLRAGNLQQALAALDSPSRSLDLYDMFPPQALACAVPKISSFKNPKHVAALRDHLLQGLDASQASTGRRILLVRLGIVLVRRLNDADRSDEAKALLAKLRYATKGLPQVQAWFE